MATDPREIQLTSEQRERLAALAEETGRPWNELLEEMLSGLSPSRTAKGNRSLYEALQARGMIGGMKGPGDLGTKRQHMEGLGEPRHRAILVDTGS